MRGRDFLDLAKELLPGTASRHWRAVVIHAYYAILLECRDAMERWGLPALTHQQVHAQVRLRLVYATDPDLKKLGRGLEFLVPYRNRASYDLRPSLDFSSSKLAQSVVQDATSLLAILDSIDNDPLSIPSVGNAMLSSSRCKAAM